MSSIVLVLVLVLVLGAGSCNSPLRPRGGRNPPAGPGGPGGPVQGAPARSEAARVLQVTITDANVTAELSALAARLRRPEALAKVLGRDAANQLKAHFLKRQATPNRLGGPRTNFWRAVRASVQAPVIREGGHAVSVAITHPAFRQKVEGGTIRAKRARALTIPVHREAYGRTAATVERETGTKVFVLKFGAHAFLARALGEEGIRILYVLRSSVTQQPDPAALPERGGFVAALLARARGYVDRVTQNPSSAAA